MPSARWPSSRARTSTPCGTATTGRSWTARPSCRSGSSSPPTRTAPPSASAAGAKTTRSWTWAKNWNTPPTVASLGTSTPSDSTRTTWSQSTSTRARACYSVESTRTLPTTLRMTEITSTPSASLVAVLPQVETSHRCSTGSAETWHWRATATTPCSTAARV